MNKKTALLQEIDRIPENIIDEVLDFVTFLKQKARRENIKKTMTGEKGWLLSGEKENREKRNSLVDFFRKSPLYDLEIDLSRNQDTGREIEL